MTEDETDTASNVESIPKKSFKKVLIIIVVLAVIAALGAGGVYAYNQHQAEVVAEANAAAETVYNGFQVQYDKIVAGAGQGEEAAHEATLAALVSLNDLKTTVEADSTTMYDGTHEGRDNVLKNINSSISTLKERISKEYDDTLAANTIDVNAEGVTKDALTAANEALAALKTLMSTDKEAVEILDGERYDAMIKNIDELSAAYAAKIEEIHAAEEAAAAKAAEEAAAAEQAAINQNYNSGGYDNSYSGGGNSGGGSYSGGGGSSSSASSGGGGSGYGIYNTPPGSEGYFPTYEELVWMGISAGGDNSYETLKKYYPWI